MRRLRLRRCLTRGATIDPGIRADMYASWKMILDQNGVDDLRDYEIVLMSYQGRDSKAYDAVRNGDSVVGPVWYDKYVLYKDNQKLGPTYGVATDDLSGRDVFGTRQAWTDDANLTLDQAKRVKDLVYQGITIYEPNPLQSTEDNLMIAAQRSAMAASALLLTKATMAGLAGTTLTAGVGIGLRAVGGSAAWLFRGGVSTYYDAMATVERYGRAAFWEDELGVLDPKTAMRVSEFGQMVGMRMGTPVTDILVKAAGKTPFIGGDCRVGYEVGHDWLAGEMVPVCRCEQDRRDGQRLFQRRSDRGGSCCPGRRAGHGYA